MCRFKKNRYQQGVTLIELLIAMGLGILVIISVSNGLLSMTNSSRLQNRNAELQESADSALSYISYNLRSALSAPCERFSKVEQLTVSSKLNGEFADEDIKASDKIGDLFTGKGLEVDVANLSKKMEGSTKLYHSDNITLLTTEERLPIEEDVNYNSKDIAVNAIFSKSVSATDTVYVISDCKKLDVFRAKAKVSNGKTKLKLRKGDSIVPRYSVEESMVGAVNVSQIKVEENGSLVHKSLFKKSGGPLMGGVELIRIVFGIDKDNDGITDRFITTKQLDDIPVTNKVVSADVYMMVRVGQADPVLPKSYELEMPNTSVDIVAGEKFMQKFTITDQIQRKVFMQSVALRNNAITL